MKKLLTILLLLTIVISCNNNDDNTFNPKLKFTFNWNGETVELADFNDIKYTNENGEQLSITRMRYLISNIKLINTNASETLIKDYNLVDLTNQLGLEFSSDVIVPQTNYNAIKFTIGFDETANTLNYPDLNIVNWNWNEIWGGGYHIMQYEGRFLDLNNQDKFYALHIGTRFLAEDIFEPNHFTVTINLPNNTVLTSESEIEIQMNIAEWYKNPNVIQLNALTFPIMPQPDVQLIMHENGLNAFNVVIN